MVSGDQIRLNQILINLAGNSLKFTSNGSVIISVKKINETDDDYTFKFSIKDTGIGIAEDKLETIFDRFTQAEESTTRTFGGTGLGLNIVKQLIELMHGKIYVTSAPLQGSEFIFEITYKKTQMVESITKESNTHNLGRLKILLCEDNVFNQKLAKIVITNFGFDIDIADNGQQGLDYLQNKQYDLILMDLQMPLMDGYQTTLFIRNELKSSIPIIAMTAHSIVGEQERCFEIGMNGYVPKPFKQSELLEAISTAINEKIKKITNVDFTLIDEMIPDNETLKNEMIALFIENIPSEVDSLEKSVREYDFNAVRQKIHKMKPRLEIFKLDDILSYLTAIEKDALIENFTLATIQNICTFVEKINILVTTLKRIVNKT